MYQNFVEESPARDDMEVGHVVVVRTDCECESRAECECPSRLPFYVGEVVQIHDDGEYAEVTVCEYNPNDKEDLVKAKWKE